METLIQSLLNIPFNITMLFNQAKSFVYVACRSGINSISDNLFAKYKFIIYTHRIVFPDSYLASTFAGFLFLPTYRHIYLLIISLCHEVRVTKV